MWAKEAKTYCCSEPMQEFQEQSDLLEMVVSCDSIVGRDGEGKSDRGDWVGCLHAAWVAPACKQE